MPRNVIKVLEKDFGDIKAGQKMLISSPENIAAYIKNIPRGSFSNPKAMRRDLARTVSADNTCPVSTGIFLRIAIEQQLRPGHTITSDFPFWRVVDETHPVVTKLNLDKQIISRLRKEEAAS